MPLVEQAPNQSPDFKQSYLLRLKTLAQEQAFWLGVEGVIVSGYAASMGRCVIEALGAGLTQDEILAALDEGEQNGLPSPVMSDSSQALGLAHHEVENLERHYRDSPYTYTQPDDLV